MLNLLNFIFLTGTMLADIVLYADQDYKIPEQRDSVISVSMHREWWREDGNGKCKYTGYATPVVRDWEIVEVRDGMDIRTPPNLEDTYGLAIVFDKKVCEGKPVEKIFRTAVKERTREGMTLYKKVSSHAQDYYSAREDIRAKWVPQVLERLERIGTTNPEAKAALTAIQDSMTSVVEERKVQAEAEKIKDADQANIDSNAGATTSQQ